MDKIQLPTEVQSQINNEAEKYKKRPNYRDGSALSVSPQIYLKKGYIAGATEWAEKAQGLVDALEMAKREIVALYKTKGYSESFVTRTIDEAIAKYKEVTND